MKYQETKENIKKRKHKKIKQKIIPVSVSTLPITTGEFSSNWKRFLESQKTKETENTKKNLEKNFKINKQDKIKNKTNPRIEKQRKRKFNETKVNNSSHSKLVEKNEIWFDDVDPLLIEKECGKKETPVRKIKPPPNEISKEKGTENANTNDAYNLQIDKVTRFVALDCEMVGVGIDGKENALARVSIVNSLGDCIYDAFVKPGEKVVDYRTSVSGVRPSDIKDAPSYEKVQKEVYEILKGRILVGHALHNDLKVLLLSHSRRQIRDTAKYKPFRQLLKTKRPALRKLAEVILKEKIQEGEHSSVIDARATMKLYQLHKKEWEASLRSKVSRNDVSKSQQIYTGNKTACKKKVNKYVKRRIEKKRKRE